MWFRKSSITRLKSNRTCRYGRVKGLGDTQVSLFNNIKDIPTREWNAIIGGHHGFIHPTYLDAIQKAHSESLEVRYAMFYSGERLIGVAAFQITHFKTNTDSYSNGLMRFVAKTGEFLRAGHVHNILIAGNAFATGQQRFWFVQGTWHQKKAAIGGTAMDMNAINKAGEGTGKWSTIS